MVVDLLRSILHDPIVMPVHVHVAPEDDTFVRALLTRDPSMRLGTDGSDQVLRHAWVQLIHEREHAKEQHVTECCEWAGIRFGASRW